MTELDGTARPKKTNCLVAKMRPGNGSDQEKRNHARGKQVWRRGNPKLDLTGVIALWFVGQNPRPENTSLTGGN
jgi:hypothetical protein